jgi:hypothetical protein
MGAIKPIFREVRQAAVKGAGDLKARFRGLTDNLNTHAGNVSGRTNAMDNIDGTPNSSNANVTNTSNSLGNSSGSAGDGVQLRDERGRFAPNPDRPTDSTYDRPSGWRAGMRDTVFDSHRGPDGLVRDPVQTSVVIDPDEPWVMGHAPGYEFRHHQRSAQERGITRQEFLDEYYQSTAHLRPELPSTSSSHGHELGWDDYVGP